jgi:hypothetical protein
MIRISDELIKQGWVYLDMKPGNVGQRDGRVLLLDTDPTSFYRIPYVANEKARRHYHHFYRVSCHMIILLFCLNFVDEIPVEVMQDFIRSKGYTEEIFHDIYDLSPLTSDMISAYNNRIATEKGYPVHLYASEMMHPKTFLRHYGNFQGLHALTRLQQIIEYKP